MAQSVGMHGHQCILLECAFWAYYELLLASVLFATAAGQDRAQDRYLQIHNVILG